jgi:peptide/nickel transport system permease protein
VLGSDSLGRDVLSRVLHGGRISLLVGVAAVIVSGAIGVTLGLVSGYFRGQHDTVIMRIADIQLAIPVLILALTIMAIFGPSLRNVVIVLGVTGWVPFARIVRGEVLSVRENEYVMAAVALGAGHVRTMAKHILPNVMASVIVMASVRLGGVIMHRGLPQLPRPRRAAPDPDLGKPHRRWTRSPLQRMVGEHLSRGDAVARRHRHQHHR